jgi:ABC-type phosphate/phosphonate transport system substrate-binding protein
MIRLFPVFLSVLLFLPSHVFPGVDTHMQGGRISPREDGSLVFVLPPVENAIEMFEKFLPLTEYLEKATSRKIVLVIAQNYQSAIESIGTGEAHLAYSTCPHTARQSTARSVRSSRPY